MESRVTDGILITTIGFVVMFAVRVILVLRQIKSSRRSKRSYNIMRNLRTKDRYNKRIQPIKTLIVLGSGGHTTEMIHLLGSIKNEEYFSPINYIVAETDTTSTRRLESLRKEISIMNKKDSHDSRKFALHCIHPAFLPPNALVYKIPRAREVGQSYLTSVLTTLYSILYTARLVLLTTQPDLLIINGPGTCLPVALWCFVARLLGISRGNIVFIESFCRVKSLSLTGKVLWKMGIVDLFVVHWPELLKNVGKEGHQDEMVLLDSFLRHDFKKKEAEM